MRSALFMPLFDELADPAMVAGLAVADTQITLAEVPWETATVDRVRGVIRRAPAEAG